MPTAFLDVDSQLDFLYPAGALYVPGAEGIVPAIAHLNRYAASHGIPVISTVDAHLENDPEFRSWPPHCIAGTMGQRKPAVTLLEKRLVIPNDASEFSFEGVRQIVLEKQTTDVFETRTISRVLDALPADRFVVYGVVTEICVFHAARGLLERGKHVVVVADAVQGLSTEAPARAMQEIRSLGGSFCTVSDASVG